MGSLTLTSSGLARLFGRASLIDYGFYLDLDSMFMLRVGKPLLGFFLFFALGKNSPQQSSHSCSVRVVLTRLTFPENFLVSIFHSTLIENQSHFQLFRDYSFTKLKQSKC